MPAVDWGFQSGRRAADIDNAALKRTAVDTKAAMLDLRQTEIELEKNEAFLNAVRGDALDGKVLDETDVPNALSRMGQLALNAGLIEQGKELITAGSTMENQQSLIARREAKTKYENLQTLTNLYEGVSDAVSWDRANAQFELRTGTPSPYAGMRYDPRLVSEAKTATTTAKDRAAQDLTRLRGEHVKQQTKESQQREKYLQAQEEYTRKRTVNAGREGSAVVPPAYVTAVANELQEHLEDVAVNPGRMKAIALQYAEEAYALVQNNGLELNEAVETVVQEALDSGKLAMFRPSRNDPPGSTYKSAIALPLTKEGKIDMTKVKKNKHYLAGDGGVVYVPLNGNPQYFSAAELAEMDEAEQADTEDEDDDPELEEGDAY